jgi:hypothetical protein
VTETTRPEVAGVIDEIRADVATMFDGTVAPADIRDDLDVFEHCEHLIEGRRLDSLDVVEIVAAVEDRYGISLADGRGAEPGALTLAYIAGLIVDGRAP